MVERPRGSIVRRKSILFSFFRQASQSLEFG